MFEIVMLEHSNSEGRRGRPGSVIAPKSGLRPPVLKVTLPLSVVQIALLSSAEPEGVASRTLRGHSELRWLAHLGLLCTEDGAKHRLTEAGRRLLSRDVSGSPACA